MLRTTFARDAFLFTGFIREYLEVETICAIGVVGLPMVSSLQSVSGLSDLRRVPCRVRKRETTFAEPL